MSCICSVLKHGAATAGYSRVGVDEDDSYTTGGGRLGISSDDDGDSSSTDLLQARIGALEEMWNSARSEAEALRTELDESQAARAELEDRAAAAVAKAAAATAQTAAVRPRRPPLAEAELKQLALERLARQRDLTMDELRAFKDAATPAELDVLRSDLRLCVAELQKEEAAAATASASSEPRSGEEAVALQVELDKVREALHAERTRRESAEHSAANTREMLQNASSRMKAITLEKQTIYRQLKAQQIVSPAADAVKLNDAAERLSDLQLQLTQAEREHRAQRQSLQDCCAEQSAQLQKLRDQLNARSSETETEAARWKQETDRLQASLVAADHGHSVALAALRKEADKERAALLVVEVAAAEKRGEARAAVDLMRRLDEEKQSVSEHAGRADATEVQVERLQAEVRAVKAALASAKLTAEQQVSLAEHANVELTKAREAMHAAALQATRSRQEAVDAIAADLADALDGRRAAEARALAAEESIAALGAEAANKAAALASAMEDAQGYRARLLASNLANERRWAAALIQRHFRRRRQARAVLSLVMAAVARGRKEEAAYRLAIRSAKQQQEDAVTAAETRHKVDLQRAKGAILGAADGVSSKTMHACMLPATRALGFLHVCLCRSFCSIAWILLDSLTDAIAARAHFDYHPRTDEAAKLFEELVVAPAVSAPHRSSPNAQLKLGTFTDMSVGSQGGARRA